MFIADNQQPIKDMGGGVTRTIITWDERMMLVKVTFERGAIGAVHHHYHTQISYVEKGVFEVTINDELQVLGTGSTFYVPPNAPHGVRCLEAGTLLDMFSPMREDFL